MNINTERSLRYKGQKKMQNKLIGSKKMNCIYLMHYIERDTCILFLQTSITFEEGE